MRDRKADNLVRKQLWLEQCAWANRQVPTPSEARLWSALCSRRLGVQFRREVPLAGRYIVDFCAPSVRLVVEVDGACHASRRRADARRDAALRGLGDRVLRVDAALVMRDLTGVVALVRAALGVAISAMDSHARYRQEDRRPTCPGGGGFGRARRALTPHDERERNHEKVACEKGNWESEQNMLPWRST